MTEEQKMLMELQGIKVDEINPLEEVKNDKAFISNDIINALFQNSTMIAFKIMFYVARAKNSDITLVGEQYKISLNKKDLLSYTNTAKSTLDENVKKLQQTLITFYSKKNKQFFTRVQLLGKCEYSEDGKSLIVNIDKDIYVRLKQTTAEHTEINTIDIMNVVKHKHSIRMLMLINYIQGFTTNQSKKYTLEQLNYMFDTKYKTLYEFERKILIPVKDELDNNSSLTFEYIKVVDMDYTGKGRKPIKEIRIKPISKKHLQTTIFSNLNYEQIQQPAQSQEQELKITPDLFTELRLKYDTYLHSEDDEKNFMKYLKETMKEFKDYAAKHNLEQNEKRFKTWVQNAENDMIGFFYPYR